MPEYKLPDVGEGLTEAEIVTWRVEVGDTVAVNDVLVEIETAKSIVELPSPYAGEVTALLVAEGDTVEVGTAIVTIGEPVTQPATEPATEPGAPAPVVTTKPVDAALETPRALPGEVPDPVELAPARVEIDTNVPPQGEPTLVGYGPRQRVLRRRPRRAGTTEHEPPGAGRRRGGGPSQTREPVKGVRKQMAVAMTASAFTAPHVTEWVTVDVTATVELVERLRAHPELAQVKVSPLLVAAKACLLAMRRTPLINSWFDEEAQEVLIKRRVHLGIAASTPRGLVVPNVKDAQDLSLRELAEALDDLIATARSGRTPPADQTGGTFTITNVGVFGVDGGTPIINPGESAILCLGAIRRRPWVVEDAVVPREVMTLALSFDHRHIDGATGSRFLADVASLLADPAGSLLF